MFTFLCFTEDIVDSNELSQEIEDKSDDEDDDDVEVYVNDDVCDNADVDGANDNTAVKTTDHKEEESIVHSALNKIISFIFKPFTLISDGYHHIFSSHPAGKTLAAFSQIFNGLS